MVDTQRARAADSLQRVWNPCMKVKRDEFSHEFNSIGLPVGTSKTRSKIIPDKLRRVEQIEKSIGHAIKKWKG